MEKRRATERRIGLLERTGRGGVCHYSYKLGEGLSRLGVGVEYLSNVDYELDDLPRSFTLHKLIRDQDPYLTKWRKILAFARRHDIDILHVQTLVSARRDVLLFARMKLLPFRVVLTAHNLLPHDEAERRAAGMRRSFRWIYRLSDAVIVHSDGDKAEMVERFGVDPATVHVILHGDYEFVPEHAPGDAEEIRARHGIGPRDLLILQFGPIRRYKGIHLLIAALAEVAAGSPRPKLLILGEPVDAAYHEELVAQIAAAGLEEDVLIEARYVPFDRVASCFEAADAVALTYEHIYDSGVLRLAFAASKPVIATRVGIFTELVRDGWNGLLTDGSVEGIVACLRRLQSMDRPELEAMGANSREAYGERHSWARIATDTVALYESLLGRPVAAGQGAEPGPRRSDATDSREGNGEGAMEKEEPT